MAPLLAALGGPVGIGIGVLSMIPAVVQLVQSFTDDPSDENAQQLRQARDALAGRLAQETGMPIEQAHQMLSEHLGDAVQAAGQGGDDNTLSAILSGAMAAAGAVGAYRGVKGMRSGKGADAAPAAPTDPLKRPPTRDEMAAMGVLEGRKRGTPPPDAPPKRASDFAPGPEADPDGGRQGAAMASRMAKPGMGLPYTPTGGREGAAMAADRMAQPGMGLPYERGFTMGPTQERGFDMPNRPRGSGRPPRTVDAEFEILPGTDLPAPPPPAGLLPWEDYGAMERNRLLGSMYRYEGG